MPAPPWELDLQALMGCVLQASQEILEVYGSDFNVREKDDASPVTQADERAHGLLHQHLTTQTPHFVLSEEDQSSHAKGLVHLRAGAPVFLVDPLDGTKEFVKKNGQFTLNIGLVVGHQPVFGLVYAPVSREILCGWRDSSLRQGWALHGKISATEGRGSEIKGVWSTRSESLTPQPVLGGGFEESANGAPALAVSEELGSARRPLSIYLSGSHRSSEQERLAAEGVHAQFHRLGSTLKFCRLVQNGLDNAGDLYLRLTPTSMWDTAAGQAALLATGGGMISLEAPQGEFSYARETLLNPGFVAWRSSVPPGVVQKVLRALKPVC